ncbi:bone marrow stromal antigen 2 [Saimiri boliviensis]|uniref:Bone marrow stromal antigen 2 n=1 Tax=Saimiri boliviensis boliviensis TaxID=39432 RepID=A0A2K6TMV5_SAIBB|nr:bone marrow stromal antigen 2 [Saimiri boliviensis boliviensis]
MAPTLFHYPLVPIDDFLKHERKERYKLLVGIGVVVLLVIVVMALGTLLIIYVKRANSEDCQEGHRAVMECRNATHLLEQKLTLAQDGFRDAEAQVATYNQTVMTLMASLDKEKAHSLDVEKKVEELEGEITTLNQKLQDASMEVERLRRKNQDLSAKIADQKDSASSLKDTSSAAKLLLLIPLLGLGARLL